MNKLDVIEQIVSELQISETDATKIADKAWDGGEVTEKTEWQSWLETRFLPNCVQIDENGYTKMCVNALKILNNTAATDYGSSRQRDLGQLWADMTRGYLGEYAFKLFLEKNWGVNVSLGHEAGELDKFLPTDVHEVIENGVARPPNLNISIKTSKWNGIWLDIPGDQFNHADIHLFVKVGTGRDHLFAFFKHISVFKHKVLKKGVEVGSLTDQESSDLFDALPSFAPIPAYICGFVKQAETYKPLPYSGKKGRKHYTVSGWNGEMLPGDLNKIKVKENLIDDGKVQFKGIGSFSHDKGYLFNTGNLLWGRDEWSAVIGAL